MALTVIHERTEGHPSAPSVLTRQIDGWVGITVNGCAEATVSPDRARQIAASLLIAALDADDLLAVSA